MQRYTHQIIEKARELRSLGKTYTEIKLTLQADIPKSTFSSWFKDIKLPEYYRQKIIDLNGVHLSKVRYLAREANKIRREQYLKKINEMNIPVAQTILNKNTAKIALAMLCLGEASKSGHSSSFYFGNSDPKTIVLFLELLKACYNFDLKKVRCTVQCRDDQDIQALEKFWRETTSIPKELFYKTRVDKRTIGKATKKSNYKGVLRIDYFDYNVRYELESLASLVYNQLT